MWEQICHRGYFNKNLGKTLKRNNIDLKKATFRHIHPNFWGTTKQNNPHHHPLENKVKLYQKLEI